MTLDVLSVHGFRGVEEIICVAETDESIALGLVGSFVANNARSLDGFPRRKGLEERVVGCFAGEITDEETEVGGVPFEKGVVGPFLTAALPDYCFLFVGVAWDSGEGDLWLRGFDGDGLAVLIDGLGGLL